MASCGRRTSATRASPRRRRCRKPRRGSMSSHSAWPCNYSSGAVRAGPAGTDAGPGQGRSLPTRPFPGLDAVLLDELDDVAVELEHRLADPLRRARGVRCELAEELDAVAAHGRA